MWHYIKNKSLVFIFISVVLWTLITFFLLFGSPNIDKISRQKCSELLKNFHNELENMIEENKKVLTELWAEQERFNKYIKQDKNEHLKSNNPQALAKENTNLSDNLNQENAINALNGFMPRKHLADGAPIIAILVISCNRITVQRCLDQLIRYRPNVEQFPIIVSQDCGHQRTSETIKKYGSSIIHIKQPDQSDIEVPPREKKFKGYFKIARHYGWALNEVFFNYNYETVVIVEDDLDIAPDFFEYFLGTHPILVNDPSLWCVSAWNDNGKPELVDQRNPHLLYRTDFFPGLGWMLTRKLWQELSPKWPKSYWDDWIRQPEQRKNRACIRPELPRTRTFGKYGVSNGMFYEKHLQYIKLNDQFVPFTKMNLTYLMKDIYDVEFVNEVYKSEVVTYADLKANKVNATGPIRIPYYTRHAYKTTAKMLGLMDDFKSGVPRTGYRGIVTFFYNGHRVHLAPSSSWSGYDLSWS